MYSFVELTSRYRRLLLVFVVLFMVANAQRGGVPVSELASTLSFSLGSSFVEPLLPCPHLNEIYIHGEVWKYDDCTTCSCDNSTTNCVIESCQDLPCSDPIKLDGECCRMCPFYAVITSLSPELTGASASVTESQSSRVQLNLEVGFVNSKDTTAIRGEKLWKLNVWTSRSPRGEGPKISFVEQAFTKEQQSTSLLKKSPFRFRYINYDMDLASEMCSSAKFICVRFLKGPEANPSFFFSAEPDDEVLTECIPSPPCQGVVARGLTWNYRAADVIAGQANPLFINAIAHFTSTSRSVSGTGLWRLGIFGSRNADGTGERFNYVNQTLKALDADMPLMPGEERDIQFAEAMAHFDIAAIGCNGFNYACMELTKGDDATPDFTFSVLDDLDDDNILTLCEMATCRAVSNIIGIDTELQMGSVVDDRPINLFSITMEVDGGNVGAAGKDLWRVSAFGSSSPQGLGPKLNYQSQVLSEEQQDLTLELLQPMDLGPINFNFDMTGLTCSEVKYICLSFDKLEEATTVFSLRPVPDERVLTQCEPTECDAVFARQLSWDYLSEKVTLGLKSPLTISSVVEFTPTGKDVTGAQLWKLSLFGSKNKQGTGHRFTPIEQLLTDAQAATAMRSGSPLRFDNLTTEFDVGWLGCGEFQFLCVEFSRGDNPQPDFYLLFETGNSSLVVCKRSTCESVLNLENFRIELVRGSIMDGRRSNRFILHSSVDSPELGIAGDDLWRMMAFGSQNADGSGERYYEQAQVLDNIQQDMGVEAGQELNFGNVGFNFDMTALSCSQVKYLCLTLQKNPRSSVDFSLATEDGLTRCVELECEGVYAESLSWQYRPVSITLGQDSPLMIDATVQMTDMGSSLSGSSLWQLGLFGSRSAMGEGPRYNHQQQILSRRQARLEYSPVGSPLHFNETGITFDISAIGCSDFTHLCVEFGQAESPRPQFSFFTKAGTSTLTQCQERTCTGNVGVKPLTTQLRRGSIVDNRPVNKIRMDAAIQSVDLGVAGSNLWRVSSFGSSNSDGTGMRYGEQFQVLKQRQQDKTLPPDGREMDFGPVDFNFDMTELGCAEVRFMCLSFSRNPGASLNFMLVPQPDERALTSCQPVDCEGVYAESLSFRLDTTDIILGQKSPVIVHANVTFADIGVDISGEQLWKLSLFGSQSSDGNGERFSSDSQILNEELEGLAYWRGNPLVFPDSISLFNIGAIGCKKWTHVCLEFGQTNRPRPQFYFFTVSQEPTLITCQERTCASAIKFNPLQTTLNSGSVVDDRPQNRIQLGVSIDGSTVGVTGNRLWELSAFGSSNPDGSGKKYLEKRQVLNDAQTDTTLLPGEPMNFGSVDFNLDMTGRGCGEVQYVCVSLQRNPRASVEFEIETNKTTLTSCQRLDCDGVFFESMNWLYESDPVMLGEETGMEIHAMIQSKLGTQDVQGEGLWQLNLFASRNEDGSGERAGLKRQILDEQTAGQPLMGGTPLNLLNVQTSFDLGQVGCSDYLYLCLEFARGRVPQPPFYMFTIAGTPTLINCQRQPCQSAVDIIDVVSTRIIGNVVEERPLNLLAFNVSALSSLVSSGLSGSNLWRVTVFGSNSDRGQGPELNPQEQALVGRQADMDLKPGGRVEFGPLNVNYNMMGVDCTSISYICARLSKNPSASIDYQLQAMPDDSVLTECQPVDCRGVLAESLSWGYSARDTIINQPSPVTIDATVAMSDSRQLSGSGLWRMGLYASQRSDGSGPRLNYTEQILDARAAGTPLASGLPLSIASVQTNFDVGSLGCSEFTHLCAEFARGDSPAPGFKFEISDGGRTITECLEVECTADVILSGLSAVLTNNEVKEGSGNQLRLLVRATPGRDSKGVAGSGLWQLSAYVTPDPLLDTKLALRRQTLTQPQEDLTLRPRQILDFGSVEYKHDLINVLCSQAHYLCVELSKGASPSATFNLLTVPEGNSLKACNPLQCKGVRVDRIDWSYEASNIIPGQQTPFSIQASISTTEDTRDLSGKNLWRLGLFGSRNPDGSGERHDYVRQTLNRDQSSTGISSGANLDFTDINTQFDAGTVGCTDYQYVCLEFAKGDAADPDFTFSVTDHRSDAGAEGIVSCKKAPCKARVEFINLNAAFTDDNPIFEDSPDNEIVMSVLALASLQSSAIMGKNLWTLKSYLSTNEEGRGRQYAVQEQVLTSPEERNEPLEPAGDLSWMDLRVPLDMSGLECSKTPYVCLTLEKNDDSTMDFTVVGIPNEDILTDCVDISSRCEGVVATELEWNHEVGDYMAGQPAMVNLDVTVETTEKSRDVDGLRLWRLGLFGSRQADGGGQRLGSMDQILDPYRQAKELTGGSPLQFTDVQASFDLGQLGCSDFQFLCLEFDKVESAQPDFAFKVQSGEDTLVSCKPQPCRGVYLTGLTSTPGVIELREGSPTNTIEFSSEATSSPLGGGVQGFNLWRMAVFGSSQPSGEGPRYGFQSQVLAGYHGSLPLSHAGDPIDFQSIRVDFDMTGVRCTNMKHFCTELSKDPASSPDFQLMAVPNDEVLTSCFPIPARACTGLVLSSMDWTMESGKLTNDQNQDFSLNVRVDSLPGGAQVSGNRLWRVGIFGSRNEDGTGDRLGYRAQILDRRTASASLTPGSYLQMSDVQAEFDFSRLGCDLKYQYFCVEFAKGIRAYPDFNMRVEGQRSNALVDCKMVECKKPVKIGGIQTQVVGTNAHLVEGNRYNRVMFTLIAATTPDSGSVEGNRLWALTVFGSENPTGTGTQLNPQRLYTFSRYQEGKAAVGGQPVMFGYVDINYDMTGLACADVGFMCARLRKHDNPSPDFDLVAIPDQSVLTDCFQVKCDGVIIEGTRLELSGPSELDVGLNDLNFDVTVVSSGNGAEVSGNNLWRVELFTAKNRQGTEEKNILNTQTLSPEMASRDLRAGSILTFRNLAAQVDRNQILCQEDNYLCVNLHKANQPSREFTLEGASPEALVHCRKVSCAKKR